MPPSNSLFNPTAFARLPSAATQGRVEAVLLEYDIAGKQEKPAWLFLINPASMRFKDSAEYGTVSPLASRAATHYYQSSKGATLTIDNILLSTYCYGKSVKSLIEGARALLKAKPESNQFAPPVLMFQWGTRRFGPCVLTSLEWDESAWLGGDPAKAVMSMSFSEIPRPLTKAEKEEKARVKDTAIAQKRTKEGKPPLPLTTRQREEAETKAKQFLQANTKLWAPDVQAAIAKGNYKLSADPDSGDVSMVSAAGQKIGVVLRSLGEGPAKADGKTCTIPLAQGAKLPEEVAAKK